MLVAPSTGCTATTRGAGQPAVKPGSFALNSPSPQVWRTSASKFALSVAAYAFGLLSHCDGPCTAPVSDLYVKSKFAHPSVYATRTRPCLSTDASLKSSRLRHAFEPPPFQMQPRWIGLPGVASTVDQVLPPS